MTTDRVAGAVADTDMDMAAGGGYSAGKTDNFEMSCAGASVGLVGKTDIVISETACAGADPACFYPLFRYQLLDFFFQILAGF